MASYSHSNQWSVNRTLPTLDERHALRTEIADISWGSRVIRNVRQWVDIEIPVIHVKDERRLVGVYDVINDAPDVLEADEHIDAIIDATDGDALGFGPIHRTLDERLVPQPVRVLLWLCTDGSQGFVYPLDGCKTLVP